MIKIIQLLIIAGSDINKKGGLFERQTPIFTACETGLNLVVKELLRFNPKPNLEHGNSTFVSCLSVAVSHNDVEIAEMLIKAGANLEAKNPSLNEMTPLLIAAENDDTEMIKLLISSGANIKAESKDEWNVLHFAARHGNLAVCKELIEKAKSEGVDLDTLAYDVCMFPCDLAIRHDQAEVVKVLLEHQYTWTWIAENIFRRSVDTVKAVVEGTSNAYSIDMRDLRSTVRFDNKEVLRYMTTLPKTNFSVPNDCLEELISLTKDLEKKALLQKIYNKLNDIPEIKKEENA